MTWKLALRALPYILCAVLGFSGAWKIQQARIESRDVKLAACHDANATAGETINQLQEERNSAHIACEKVIRSKEHTIAELKRIDSLTGVLHNEIRNPQSEVGSDTADAVLAELNGMFNPGR